MTPTSVSSESVIHSVQALHDALMNDLDEQNGGCLWWHGYQDWRRLVLINDYNIGSLSRVKAAIKLRDRHSTRFNELWTTENYRISQDIRMGDPKPYPLGNRTENDERRQLDIEIAVRGFFDASASVLDLLAASIVIVGAIRVEVKDTAWSIVERCSKSEGQRNARILDDFASAGRARQEELIRTVRRASATNPSGWLDWTVEMRNAFLHRGGRAVLSLQSSRLSKSAKNVQLFHLVPIDPTVSDVEAMAVSADSSEVYMNVHAGDLMKVVSSNVNYLIKETCTALDELWRARKADPTLLVQPGQQWREIKTPTKVGLVGDFDRVRWPSGKSWAMAVHSDDLARWEAAKMSDRDANRHWGARRSV